MRRRKNQARLDSVYHLDTREVLETITDNNKPFSAPGGSFFLSFAPKREKNAHRDSAILRRVLSRTANWETPMARSCREEPTNISSDCPWCGHTNHFNATALLLLYGAATSDECFVCHNCLRSMGNFDLWMDVGIDDESIYPNEMIAQTVKFFPYPITDESGIVHGMPFHKGLYFKPTWRSVTQTDTPRGLGIFNTKYALDFGDSSCDVESETDFARYSVIKMNNKFLVGKKKHLSQTVFLRLVGVSWGRKRLWLSTGRHCDRLRGAYTHWSSRGVKTYYSLFARVSTRSPHIAIRRVKSPSVFREVKSLDF